jgi:hypothetical protein
MCSAPHGGFAENDAVSWVIRSLFSYRSGFCAGMSSFFIQALERKPWERHVQTNAKSTFLAQRWNGGRKEKQPRVSDGMLADFREYLETGNERGAVNALAEASLEAWGVSDAEILSASGLVIME